MVSPCWFKRLAGSNDWLVQTIGWFKRLAGLELRWSIVD
jgi:hypothetical protein